MKKSARMTVSIILLLHWMISCLGVFAVCFNEGLRTWNLLYWIAAAGAFLLDVFVGGYLGQRLISWAEEPDTPEEKESQTFPWDDIGANKEETRRT